MSQEVSFVNGEVQERRVRIESENENNDSAVRCQMIQDVSTIGLFGTA
jgi:predicted transport protein